jgi:hypothetical protein
MVNEGLQEGLRDIVLTNPIIFLNSDNVKKANRFLACSRCIGLGKSGRTLTGTIEDKANTMFPGKLEIINVEQMTDVPFQIQRKSRGHASKGPIGFKGTSFVEAQPLKVPSGAPSRSFRRRVSLTIGPGNKSPEFEQGLAGGHHPTELARRENDRTERAVPAGDRRANSRGRNTCRGGGLSPQDRRTETSRDRSAKPRQDVRFRREETRARDPRGNDTGRESKWHVEENLRTRICTPRCDSAPIELRVMKKGTDEFVAKTAMKNRERRSRHTEARPIISRRVTRVVRQL